MKPSSKPRSEMSHDEIIDETIDKMGGDKKFIEFYKSLTFISDDMKTLYDHLSWHNRIDTEWLDKEGLYHEQ